MINLEESQVDDSVLHEMVIFRRPRVVAAIIKLGGKIYQKTIQHAID